MKSSLQNMANAIRALSMDAVEKANSGHPGMPMGMADVATILFTKFLKFNPKNPNWADRDRFILSAGHGSMLLYSLLYLTGYEEITLDEIKNFRQLHAKTCGHPEFGEAGGIETTTGPLGQGIANSVGFAIAERGLNARFGNDLVNHYTYVIAGDGCLMEGISQEAISLAGHLKLNKLIVLFDDNQISIDGPTSLATSEDQIKRFQASNWNTISIDGHNFAEIENAIAKAQKSDKPTLIACRTIIAKGAPTKAGTSDSHGSPLGKAEIEGARKNLNWDYAPFEIPSEILNDWREAGARSEAEYDSWNERLKKSDKKSEFERVVSGKLPANFAEKINEAKLAFAKSSPMATRKSSGMTLEYLVDALPELIGGSADLTGSNLTKTKTLLPFTSNNYSGRYIYYGVREHAMCSAMNGIALHGGFIPYGGTFFVFTDYCKPAIRLAALMKQRVIFVMTHDSIGLGEDGPTHQPIEHLSALRAVPNLQILRPADAVETAECWQIALESESTPSVLVLTRQNLPNLRGSINLPLQAGGGKEGGKEGLDNLCRLGAYEILPEKNPDVIILATGSEVGLSVDAAKDLIAKGKKVRVVSFVSWELFENQSEEYKNYILGEGSSAKIIAVEAASKLGWERYIGRKGIFIGMNSFGASAPAEKLYEYFGITKQAIIDASRNL
ncbi:MAG: transketolase [Rickettsiales bacterium]|nr:transketolase [Rickettsiales bacterium]